MTNEEKILAMLEQLQQGQEQLQQGQEQLQQGQEQLQQGQEQLHHRQEQLQQGQEQLQQGQEQANARLDCLETDMKVVKEKVEYMADVLEGTLKLVDDLDRKYRAM